MTPLSTQEEHGARGLDPAGLDHTLKTRKAVRRAERDDRRWTIVESREWIEAFSKPREAERATWTGMLEQNGVFPPRLKFSLSPDLEAGLQAEILPDESGDILERCLAVTREAAGSPVDPPSIEAGDNTLEALRALCKEAGWEAQMRNGAIVIPLEPALQAGPVQLVAFDGAVRVFLELPHASPETDVVREARELFLLRLGHLVRLIRPVRRRRGDEIVTELEASFPGFPTPEHLGHALSALATAARSAAEFQAMGDDHLAGHYLASMRRSAPRADAQSR